MDPAIGIAIAWIALVVLIAVIVGWWFVGALYVVLAIIGTPTVLYAWWWLHTWTWERGPE